LTRIIYDIFWRDWEIITWFNWCRAWSNFYYILYISFTFNFLFFYL